MLSYAVKQSQFNCNQFWKTCEVKSIVFLSSTNTNIGFLAEAPSPPEDTRDSDFTLPE